MSEWKNLPISHKIAIVVIFIAAAIVIICNFVNSEVFPENMSHYGIAVITICEAVLYWDKKRKMAYLLIAAAIMVLLSCALEMFI